MTPAPLIVVSGPSGVGKTTVVEEVIRRKTLPLRRAITATTRKIRPGETEDVSYHFWSVEKFEQERKAGHMLECAHVFGTDYYGTPLSEVEPYRAKGTGVILVIDVQGAASVREKCGPDCLTVFIAPPSFEELEARLRGRGDVLEEKITRRLETAAQELARAGEFDHRIVNRELAQAVQDLETLIRARLTERK
jgi:guanylate kinase